MSPTREEVIRQWKAFGNGVIHAIWTGCVSGLVAVGGWGLGAIDLREAGLVVGSAVISGLFGFFRQSPLPPLFVIDDDIKVTLREVTVERKEGE